MCLRSGVPVRDEVAKSLRSIEEICAKQHKEFLENQIQSNTNSHQPSVRVQEHGEGDILEECQKIRRRKQGYFGRAI